MTQHYTRQDSSISAQVGDEFVLTLDANPSSGHQWQLAPGQSLVRLVDRQPRPAAAAVGSGASEDLRLRCVAAGAATLELRYQRPWETAAADRFTIALQVR